MTNSSFSGRAPTAASFGAPLRPPVFDNAEEPVFNVTPVATASTTEPVPDVPSTTTTSDIAASDNETSQSIICEAPIPDLTKELTSATTAEDTSLEPTNTELVLKDDGTITLGSASDLVAASNEVNVSDENTVDVSAVVTSPKVNTESEIIDILDLVEEKLTENTQPQANDLSIRVGRVDSQELPYRIQRPRNKAIYKAVSEWRKNGSLPTTLVVRGTIITNNRMPGLWDEGGADNNEGSVLLAADPEGNRITPVVVNSGLKTVNGKHALIQVWEGCFIVVGWHRGGKEIIGVYLVDEVILAVPGQEDPSPRFSCTLQGYVSKHKWIKSSTASAKIDLGLGHPMVVAAESQLFRQHSVVPGYTGDYIEHYFPVEDYNEWEKDPVVSFTEETSIRKVYATAEKLFAPFTAGPSSQKALLMIVFMLANNDEVHAYILAGIYDSTVRSTRGNRLMYRRLVLNENSVFYYPDRDDVPKNRLNITAIKEALLAQPVHTLAMAFRRVTNSSHYNYFKNLKS